MFIDFLEEGGCLRIQQKIFFLLIILVQNTQRFNDKEVLFFRFIIWDVRSDRNAKN